MTWELFPPPPLMQPWHRLATGPLPLCSSVHISSYSRSKPLKTHVEFVRHLYLGCVMSLRAAEINLLVIAWVTVRRCAV